MLSIDYVIRKSNKGYLKYDFHGKSSITTNLSLAERFTYESANSYVSNCIKPKEKWQYQVVPIIGNEIAEHSVVHTDDTGTEMPLTSPTLFENMDFNWNDTCKLMSDMFRQLPAYKALLQERYNLVSGKQTDIIHFIEFNNLNAAESCKAAKLLHRVRVERRKIKDEMQIVGIMTTALLEDFKGGTVMDKLSVMDERTYTPRALPELFEK